MTVGMGNDIIGGKKHVFRICRNELHQGLTGMHKGFFGMTEGTDISIRRGEDVKG